MIKEIYIMWLRQIKRYFRSKARIASSLGQPILFLVALWFGFGPIFEKAGGGNYLDFLVPGIISMGILNMGMFMGMEVIWDKQFGFLKETLVAPISRLTIVTGRTLGGAMVALAQGIIILLITLMIGFTIKYWAMLALALIFMFLTALLFTALGTAIASKMDDMHAFPLVMNFIIMPMFFLSGALFPLDGLPKTMKVISYFDPLSYAVDGLRATLTNVSHFGVGIDILVLASAIIIIFAVSAWLFSKIQA